MSTQFPRPVPTAGRPIGAGFLVAGLVAIAAGLLLPLALGSFSDRQALMLAAGRGGLPGRGRGGVLLMARRLRASHEALWALARRDELTGVGNYRSLHERLAEEIARHRRHAREFALVLLDLDGFKAVNERLGHLEGDRLLAEIGAALRDEVRAEDSVFRQGGDEFAVIVPEANAEEAEEVAARLRGPGRPPRLRQRRERPVRAATGFAMFPADGTTSRRCSASPTPTSSPPSASVASPRCTSSREWAQRIDIDALSRRNLLSTLPSWRR